MDDAAICYQSSKHICIIIWGEAEEELVSQMLGTREMILNKKYEIIAYVHTLLLLLLLLQSEHIFPIFNILTEPNRTKAGVNMQCGGLWLRLRLLSTPICQKWDETSWTELYWAVWDANVMLTRWECRRVKCVWVCYRVRVKTLREYVSHFHFSCQRS